MEDWNNRVLNGFVTERAVACCGVTAVPGEPWAVVRAAPGMDRKRYQRQYSVLRGYAVAGVLGGMVFYDRTGSRLLFAVLKKCSGWIKMKRRGKKSQKTGKKRTTRGQAENMERK